MIASSTLDLHEFSLPRPTSSPAPSFMSDRISLSTISEEPKTSVDSVTPLDAVPDYKETLNGMGRIYSARHCPIFNDAEELL